MTKNNTSDWLSEISDDMIVQDHLGRELILDDVIDHLSLKPHKPLPKDLINILNLWMKTTSGHRIEKMNSGRPEAEWYYLAERLIEDGFSQIKACEEIRKLPKYEDLELSSMLDMLKRYLSKRSNAQKKIDKLVRQITNPARKETFD